MTSEVKSIVNTWRLKKKRMEEAKEEAITLLSSLDKEIMLNKESIAEDIILSNRNCLEKEGRVILADRDFTLFVEGEVEQKGFNLSETYGKFKSNSIKNGKNFYVGSTTESPYFQGLFLDKRFIRYVLKDEFVKLGLGLEASRSGAFELFIK